MREAVASIFTPVATAFPKKIWVSKALTRSSQPTTSNMIHAAIIALDEAKGSTLRAIKKYIAGAYLVDAEKNSSHIHKYLNTAIEHQTLVQVKGRFKLATGELAAGKFSPKKRLPAGKTASPKKSEAGKISAEELVAGEKSTGASAVRKNTAPELKGPSKAKKKEKPKKATVGKAAKK